MCSECLCSLGAQAHAASEKRAREPHPFNPLALPHPCKALALPLAAFAGCGSAAARPRAAKALHAPRADWTSD